MKPVKSETKNEKKPARVIFYPQPYTLLVPLAMFGNFMVSTINLLHNALKRGDRGVYWLTGSMTLIFVLFIAWFLYALFLQCGSADEKGIRWRNRRGKCLTRWDEITDFHQIIGSGFVVKTERDTITLRSYLVHAERLRDFILSHCGERLNLAAWELHGSRPRDFPQVFDYPEKPNQKKLRLGQALLFPALVLLGGGLTIAHLLVSLEGGLITIDIALLAISSALGLGGLSFVRTAAAMRERAVQKFTAQADGFTFDTGREAVFVAWGDVIGYDFHPQAQSRRVRLFPPLENFRLRTEQGQEFAFLAAIDRVELWTETIRRLATNGIETKIDQERKQALGGVGLCWSGGVEGVGDRVFHARTRTNLALPVVFGIFALIPVALTASDLLGWISLPLTATVVPPLFAVGVEAVLIANYCTRRVAIGADGITYSEAGRRTQHISWRDVAEWKNDFGGIRIDTKSGTHLRFKPTELAYGSRIAPLIEEHLRGTSAKRRGESATALSPAAAAADR